MNAHFHFYLSIVALSLSACSATNFGTKASQSGGGDAKPKTPVIIDCRAMSKAECDAKVANTPTNGPRVDVDCNGKTQAQCQEIVNKTFIDKKDGGPIVINGNEKPGPTIDNGTGPVTPPGPPINPTPTPPDLGGGGGGLVITKVGVNFEDSPGGDRDFNDAVMCFEMKGTLNGTVVHSTMVQTIQPSTYNHSDCVHTVRVVITHADSTIDTQSYLSNSTAKINLNFKVGSKLDVYVKNMGECGNAEKHMSDKNSFVVSPNICNNTGK